MSIDDRIINQNDIYIYIYKRKPKQNIIYEFHSLRCCK